LATITFEDQLRHRLAIVDSWDVREGDSVLEVGCGQGGAAVALAYAVGEAGRVLATDIAPADYGGPSTLGDAHEVIRSVPLGKRIEFLTTTDPMSPELDFGNSSFDLVAFCHCSWYMSSAAELGRLFARVRPWSKRLGFCEWDLRPRHKNQIPHMASVLLQARIQALWQESPSFNVRSLTMPSEARSLAEQAGWTITHEEVTETSMDLSDGRKWEIDNALDMADLFADAFPEAPLDRARHLVSTEADLLRALSDSALNRSLPTYVFLAE
jgi:SAM-dependent methyltransferase